MELVVWIALKASYLILFGYSHRLQPVNFLFFFTYHASTKVKLNDHGYCDSLVSLDSNH